MANESEVPPTGSNPDMPIGPGESIPVTVRTEGATTGGLAILDRVIAVSGQFNVALPIVFELTRTIIALFRDRDPAEPLPTDEQVIAHLRARALEDREANEAWLREKGYL